MDSVHITVPLIPPSVNDYKRPNWKSRCFYVTKEAKAFKEAIAIFARGRSVEAKEFSIHVTIYLGKGQRLDGDNAWKCIGDGLKDAGVIRSDAAVMKWVLLKDRDRENPRTEINVEAL